MAEIRLKTANIKTTVRREDVRKAILSVTGQKPVADQSQDTENKISNKGAFKKDSSSAKSSGK
jgi:hypothetical protein